MDAILNKELASLLDPDSPVSKDHRKLVLMILMALMDDITEVPAVNVRQSPIESWTC